MPKIDLERVRAKDSRVKRLREKALCTPAICVERGYLMTESYKETAAQPPVIRRAKATEKVLREMTINIDDDELIVGKATTKQRGAPLIPEINWKWYLEEMDHFSTRDYDRFLPIATEDKVKMTEFLPYWEGRSLMDKWRAWLPGNAEELYYEIAAPNASPINCINRAHNAADFEKVLNAGLTGIKKGVEAELAKLDITDLDYLQKSLFLKAVSISIDAAIGFAERYARLARSLAVKETDAERKAELERIAGTCDRVPAHPARSFYEALQSVWFTFVTLMVEGWGNGMAFGRADQYLYPFYKADIQEGRITREEARELIALFYIKMNGLVTARGGEVVKIITGFPSQFDLILGGVTKAGKDAVNELSYLFLEADDEVGLQSPDIVIRVNKITPDAFLVKACESLRSLKGILKFVSDETAIQQLLKDGKPPEYARDYIISGCFAPTVPGRSDDLPGAKLNLPLMLELALNNGVSRTTGKQTGLKTGDPRKFQSYDEVWHAYRKQVEAQIPTLILFRNADSRAFVEFAPTPLFSALFEGCIKKGLDVAAGGTAPYISQALGAPAAPNVGDSLAAIKKAVFEDQQITMERLIDALDKNFEGEDAILTILASAPKFGNDDDYVDSIVNEVLVHFSNAVAKYKGIAGAVSTLAAATVTANLTLGALVGALPDGRRAGEPLSEGGISPYQGRNVSGPTATMRSVAKLDHLKLTNGSVLNMRFSPDALKDEQKIKKFASLIRTFCETGGFLVQFNITSTDVFRDAQKHPGKYRDLLVRVATYSAYFVELSPKIQEDIIARMEFQEV